VVSQQVPALFLPKKEPVNNQIKMPKQVKASNKNDKKTAALLH
jgi:hypothetical protein